MVSTDSAFGSGPLRSGQWSLVTLSESHRLFVLASTWPLNLYRGSAPTGITAAKEGVEKEHFR